MLKQNLTNGFRFSEIILMMSLRVSVRRAWGCLSESFLPDSGVCSSVASTCLSRRHVSKQLRLLLHCARTTTLRYSKICVIGCPSCKSLAIALLLCQMPKSKQKSDLLALLHACALSGLLKNDVQMQLAGRWALQSRPCQLMLQRRSLMHCQAGRRQVFHHLLLSAGSSLSLSLSFSVRLSLSLFLSLSLYLLSLFPLFSLSVSLPFSRSLSLYIYIYLSLSLSFNYHRVLFPQTVPFLHLTVAYLLDSCLEN